MARRSRIYEGKDKILYEGPEPGTLVQYFKDDTATQDNAKTATITGKGVLNNRISEYMMLRLHEIGVPTHFVRRLNMREQLIRELEIIPVELMVRNAAAGSFAKRFGVQEGTQLPARSWSTPINRLISGAPWCRRNISPPSVGRPRRTSTTCWPCRYGSTIS